MCKMKVPFLVLALACLVLAREAAEADTPPPGGFYVVRPGDTLSAIAVRFHTTVRELAQVNGIADPNRLRVGQRLLLAAEDANPAPTTQVPKPVVAAEATPSHTLQPASQPTPPQISQATPAQASQATPAQASQPTPPPISQPTPPPAVSPVSLPATARTAPESSLPTLPAYFEDEETFYSRWIRDRLAIGLSLSYFRLTDADRPRDLNRQKTFLGYINHLDEENPIEWAPTLNWTISDYIRLGLTYHSIEAETMNFAHSLHDVPRSDGTVSSAGLLFSIEGTYPLADGRWRPHLGVGGGMYRGDFSEDTWWGLGYPTPEDWQALGRPSKTALGKRRYIEVDDAVGVSLILGVAWRPIREFELDLSLRRTFLEPDCEFGYKHDASGRKEPEQSGEFTLDSISVVVTASYVF